VRLSGGPRAGHYPCVLHEHSDPLHRLRRWNHAHGEGLMA
jgi:hypothetical protein